MKGGKMCLCLKLSSSIVDEGLLVPDHPLISLALVFKTMTLFKCVSVQVAKLLVCLLLCILVILVYWYTYSILVYIQYTGIHTVYWYSYSILACILVS